MNKTKKLIRFDWAMKKLLRNKANFDILEGFLSELLKEDITIKKILESESNKEEKNDKYNRVDIFVEDSKGDLIIIEVQNSKEYDYFHRILYGTSKAITEYISEGDAYGKVKKVISITIAYFDLGKGKDYVYRGITQFKGIYEDDVLNLAFAQRRNYKVNHAYEIYPEYWIIKVSQFNNEVKSKLDEWIYFLKNGTLPIGYSAKGLSQAKQKLDAMNLTDKEKSAYKYYLKRLRDIASEQHTKMIDAKMLEEQEKERKKLIEEGRKKGIEEGKKKGIEEGRKKGIEEGKKKGIEEGKKKGIEEGKKKGIEEGKRKAVIGMYEIGISILKIAQALKISENEIRELIHKNK